MFGFVSLGVSFASLVISCAALYWSRMARIEAAGAVERSRYALESSRKHVGLPYDHKIVHDWELRTQFGFAQQIKDDWTRRKDSDGVADSDDAFEVFSDGTYRIVPNSGVFSVLKPVFCREHGTCDDPACPYAICAGVQRVRTSLVLCPRSGIAYIDTGGDGLEMIAYVVRCDVCAAEAFVPLNQDPDMAMSARGWRMRPHSKMCKDCVFAVEGPKIPPSMAEV